MNGASPTRTRMMDSNQPPQVQSFDRRKQHRLDELLEQNAQASLSSADQTELEALVKEAEELMVANAKQLADYAKSQHPQPPLAAVPVTVWVTPQPLEP